MGVPASSCVEAAGDFPPRYPPSISMMLKLEGVGTIVMYSTYRLNYNDRRRADLRTDRSRLQETPTQAISTEIGSSRTDVYRQG